MKLFNCYAKSIARGHAFADKDTSRFRWLWYKDKKRRHKRRRKKNNKYILIAIRKFCKLDRTFLHAREASECACKSWKCSLRSAIAGNVRLCILRRSRSTMAIAIIFRIERRKKKISQREILRDANNFEYNHRAYNYSRTLRARFHLYRMFLNRVLSTFRKVF